MHASRAEQIEIGRRDDSAGGFVAGIAGACLVSSLDVGTVFQFCYVCFVVMSTFQ